MSDVEIVQYSNVKCGRTITVRRTETQFVKELCQQCLVGKMREHAIHNGTEVSRLFRVEE